MGPTDALGSCYASSLAGMAAARTYAAMPEELQEVFLEPFLRDNMQGEEPSVLRLPASAAKVPKKQQDGTPN